MVIIFFILSYFNFIFVRLEKIIIFRIILLFILLFKRVSFILFIISFVEISLLRVIIIHLFYDLFIVNAFY